MNKRIEKAVAEDYNCFYKHQREIFFKELHGVYEEKKEAHAAKLEAIREQIALEKEVDELISWIHKYKIEKSVIEKTVEKCNFLKLNNITGGIGLIVEESGETVKTPINLDVLML